MYNCKILPKKDTQRVWIQFCPKCARQKTCSPAYGQARRIGRGKNGTQSPIPLKSNSGARCTAKGTITVINLNR